MKKIPVMLAMVMAVGMAAAQAPKATPKATAPKPQVTKPAPTKPMVTKPAPAKPMATKPAPTTQKPKTTDKPATAETKPAPTPRRRDPFVSPVVRASGPGSNASATPAPTCTAGKRCLDATMIMLRGIVKSSDGSMIAVVENPAKRAYFLRENDPVYSGYVLKITGNTVVFRLNTTDRLGKPMTHDVEKFLNAPPAA